jgi:hypothetical protein
MSTPESFLSRIQFRAAISALSYTLPTPSPIFRGIIFTVHATPETPRALFPTAPMMPATWVPWPLSSSGSSSLFTKSYPDVPSAARHRLA